MNNKLLKQARKAKRLTQATVATSAGITQAYLSMLESGKHGNMRLDTLQRLAHTLDIPIETLVRSEAASTGVAA